MDPWQPLNSKSSDSEMPETAPVTFMATFPQFHVQKTMDSRQYLSIIGKLCSCQTVPSCLDTLIVHYTAQL